MKECDIRELIDHAQDSVSGVSGECRNKLHACKKEHPLSCGDRATDFWNAAFVLSGRCNPEIVIRLNKVGEYFANKRAV